MREKMIKHYAECYLENKINNTSRLLSENRENRKALLYCLAKDIQSEEEINTTKMDKLKGYARLYLTNEILKLYGAIEETDNFDKKIEHNKRLKALKSDFKTIMGYPWELD